MFQYKHNQFTHAENTTENIPESGKILTTQKVKILYFGHNSDLKQLATAQPMLLLSGLQHNIAYYTYTPPPPPKRRIPLNNIGN